MAGKLGDDLHFFERGGRALAFGLDVPRDNRYQIVFLPILADHDAVGRPTGRAGQVVARHPGPAAAFLVVLRRQGRDALAPVDADFLR